LDEVKIITPTIRRLLAKKKRKGGELYVQIPLPVLTKAAHLGPQTAFALAVLYSIRQMQPKAKSFLLRTEFEEAVGCGPRWWRWHSDALEKAGLIHVDRRAGAKPRYRILGPASRRSRPRTEHVE